MHRVVIYRDGGDKASQTLPLTFDETADPEDLWKTLQAYEDKTGGKVLAIPHNGNWSSGKMFDVETFTGKRLDKSYAETRMRWEPIYETTQIKGDGEAHPFLSPTDEFADYETWDVGNLSFSRRVTTEMLPGSYTRSGLKRGLKFEAELGVNPYQFGLIGAGDSHTGLPGQEENNFMGKSASSEPDAERWAKLLDASWADVSGFLGAAFRSDLDGVELGLSQDALRAAGWDGQQALAFQVYTTCDGDPRIETLDGSVRTSCVRQKDPAFAFYAETKGDSIEKAGVMVSSNGKAEGSAAIHDAWMGGREVRRVEAKTVADSIWLTPPAWGMPLEKLAFYDQMIAQTFYG